jgi:hypothetical protein
MSGWAGSSCHQGSRKLTPTARKSTACNGAERECDLEGRDTLPILIALLVKRNDMHNCDTKINIEARISPNVNPRTWLGMFTGFPIPITNDVKIVIGNLVEGSLETVNLANLVDLPKYA